MKRYQEIYVFDFQYKMLLVASYVSTMRRGKPAHQVTNVGTRNRARLMHCNEGVKELRQTRIWDSI